MDLNKLLRAQSVAVVGASEKMGFAHDTCYNLLAYRKDSSRIYFVNPKRDEVLGKKCYKTISDIDDAVDLVIFCTPQQTILPILREAHAKGCGGAIIYAAGYSEMGSEEGIAAEKELGEVAQELDIAIMGPNCIGFVNFLDNLHAFACTSKERDRKGSIGFISQSGQFCLSMQDSPGVKFSFCISVGNSKVVQIEDYIDFLLEDENTSVVSLYLEGVGDPRKFIACLAKAAEKRKPVVILKAGRSERGAALTSSHTGAIAGSDKTFDAIFKKFGVIRADDLQDLISTSVLLSTLPSLPKGTAVASVNLSGGETGICADMGYLHEIDMPDFALQTKKELKALLPFSTPGNPFDTTAPPAYNPDLLAECLKVIAQDQNSDMILLGMTIMDEINDASMEVIYTGVKTVKEWGMQKPIAILSFIETTHDPDLQARFEQLGVPVLAAPKYGFSAMRHMAEYVGNQTNRRSLALAMPEGMRAGARRNSLSEHEGRKLLAQAGIKVALGAVAKTVEEAVAAAESFGYPVVMKIESADIQHKSDVGGVIVNIQSHQEVRSAFASILGSVQKLAPEAQVGGILVCPMLPQGTEMIVGVNSDPQFGPMLLVGLGGVFVEVFQDAALYPVPVNHFEAREMVESLKAYRLMEGYRGGKPADVDALVELLVEVSDFAQAHKDCLSELDVNPVFMYPREEGVGIADVLAICIGDEDNECL